MQLNYLQKCTYQLSLIINDSFNIFLSGVGVVLDAECGYTIGTTLPQPRWLKEFDQIMTTTNLNNWTWPKLKSTNLLKPTNLNFTSRVLLTSVPYVFFLVEEWSDGASKAGEVSQPVWSCQPRLGDLSKLTAPTYFFGGEVNVCGCHVNVCRCHKFWLS